MTAGGALTQAVNVSIKKFRGVQVNDFDVLENGNVKVNWQDDTVDEIPLSVWTDLSKGKRKTKRALRRLMTPLGDDVTRFEIRGGGADQTTQEIMDTAPDVVVDRDDYRVVVREDDDVEDSVTTFEAEAQLRSVDFRPGEKWRIRTVYGTRQAMVEDQEFLRSLDEGVALHKNDLFDVTIEETATTRNGRRRREWVITRVVRKRRGGDDDDGDS